MQLRIPASVVGVTVVALGTSLPEFMATTIAAWQDNAGIAYGNIVGSNVANILLILGVTSILLPQKAGRDLVWSDGVWMLIAVVALALFLFTDFLPGSMPDGVVYQLSRAEGLVLLGAQAVFMALTLRRALRERARTVLPERSQHRGFLWYLVRGGLFLASLVFLGVGSERLVAGAVELADLFGMTQLVVGLTVVAIGTSTPELATSLTAAFRREDGIAVSNITGSNIQNILFCLASAMVIAPNGIAIRNANAGLDMGILLIVTGVLFLAMLIRGRLDRVLGIVMVMGMVAYTVWLVFRGHQT